MRVLIREPLCRPSDVQPGRVVQSGIPVRPAHDRIRDDLRGECAFCQAPLREAGRDVDTTLAPPDAPDVRQPIERGEVVRRPAMVGCVAEPFLQEAFESLVATLGIRLVAGLVPFAADDQVPGASGPGCGTE